MCRPAAVNSFRPGDGVNTPDSLGLKKGRENTVSDELNIQLAADLKVRQGVYSNLSVISSQPKEDRIDFIFVDGASEDGAEGVVVSRVILTRQTLIELRNAITSHIAAHPMGGEDEQ